MPLWARTHYPRSGHWNRHCARASSLNTVAEAQGTVRATLETD